MTQYVTEAIEKSVRTAAASAATEPHSGVSQEERRHMIAEAAYYRAEHRGFSSEDSPEHDWLLAEQEVDALLARRMPGKKARRAH